MSVDFSQGRLAAGKPADVRTALGLNVRNLGTITGLTSEQIDALYTDGVPANGTIAVGSNASNKLLLMRDADKWNSTVLTAIA